MPHAVAPLSSPAPSPLRWDIFCQVIDNFGDIGVCWRLAAQLGAQGHAVRLWVDDAGALAWMAPAGAAGVQVLPWPRQSPPSGPGDVVVEAFGCELPAAYTGAIAQAARERGRQPAWINLEYLSAEGYVERCHALPSPLMSGPAAGLTRWFFYPGFTPRTGGLLREPALCARQAAFDRAAWRARYGVAANALAVALFCYEPPALGALVEQMRGRPGAHLLATPGRATAALRALPDTGAGGDGSPGAPCALGPLPVTFLAPCPQPQFDELLWACDLNFVRGEDSLVRALWAGQAFVWQLYPQHDGAHHGKLQAFLDWLAPPASLRAAHLAWNGLTPPGQFALPSAATLAEWRACAGAARNRLMAQPDLLTQLLGFVEDKS